MNNRPKGGRRPMPPSPAPTTTRLAKIGRLIHEELGPSVPYVLIVGPAERTHVVSSVAPSALFAYLKAHTETYNPLTGRQRHG